MYLCRHHQREVPQGDCVLQVDIAHKVQRFLNPVLWVNTAVPKGTRNLMTVLLVILGKFPVVYSEQNSQQSHTISTKQLFLRHQHVAPSYAHTLMMQRSL